MGDHLDTSGGCNRSSSTAISGVDWSIFEDGEEDAFGWLLRNNAFKSGVSNAEVASNTVENLDILPLDDVAMNHMMVSALAPQQQVAKSQAHTATAAATGSRGSRGSHTMTTTVQSNARVLAVQRCEDLRASSSRPTANMVSMLSNVTSLDHTIEFRKRKMKQQEQNEARLRRLEAENMDLKMQLKIGKEAVLSEQREKQQIKEQMREMLQRNANEQEIAQFLNMYKVTYSDYGPKRREKLHFHLSRIRELLLPTQVTKLSLYSVEQGVDILQRDHVIEEDPMSAPESATATVSLWGILADELKVSGNQQRQILERRAAIKNVRDDLNHTLSIVKKLEDVTDEKNTALEAQVAELQQILTPSQATKFIIWVKENPAFMYMLDRLVDSTLQNSSNHSNSAEE
ncbi:unnamed protein product [Peronospora destructor]|uniref:BZIP domain-containing protein n=1 Tax=Peronospora destructor TaxID=86335 RepID=A0AAV0V6A5_9STRA|nr:unnamed protein product [Peronospora destructor]